jgi:hypothetical protein
MKHIYLKHMKHTVAICAYLLADWANGVSLTQSSTPVQSSSAARTLTVASVGGWIAVAAGGASPGNRCGGGGESARAGIVGGSVHADGGRP